MTTDRELERLLDAWLSEGPGRVADRVVDGAAARIARQPQRPAWRLRPWRPPKMSTLIRFALLAAALLVAIGATAVVLTGGGRTAPSPVPSAPPPAASQATVVTPAPGTPSPAPTVAPTASAPATPPPPCPGSTDGCFVKAGTYTSAAFRPALTFTVADNNWMNTFDSATGFGLVPDTAANRNDLSTGGDGLDGIELQRDLALKQSCNHAAQPGVGTTASDIVHALGLRPGLVHSAPAQVTLGGLSGWWIDVSEAKTWKTTCPAGSPSGSTPIVALLTAAAQPNGADWDAGPGEHYRLEVFDLPGGGTVTLMLRAHTPQLLEPFLQQAAPIVASFSFAPGS